MAERIELSFRTDPPDTTTSDHNEPAESSTSMRAHDDNIAKLQELKIGKHTVAEVVKGLQTVLGQELYPAEILQKDCATTKIFLGQGPLLRTDEPKISDLIYNITDGGQKHTKEVRSAGIEARLEDHMFVTFRTKFTRPPSVIVGLNFLDIERSANVRITGTAQLIHDYIFDLYSCGWSNTVLRGAGFTWLAVPTYENPLLQVGTFNTMEDHNWDVKQDLTHRMVTFRSPYKSLPKVVVWLNSIDSGRECNERVVVFATDITTVGFNVHINTWGGTFLYYGAISWFAYPADTPGICSGSLQPTKGTVGVVTFDKPFSRPPRRILVALNKLEMDNCANCRFEIIHEAVSEKGMALKVQTWADSKLIQAGVSYIAME